MAPGVEIVLAESLELGQPKALPLTADTGG